VKPRIALTYKNKLPLQIHFFILSLVKRKSSIKFFVTGNITFFMSTGSSLFVVK
jgi:hypothetical protein